MEFLWWRVLQNLQKFVMYDYYFINKFFFLKALFMMRYKGLQITPRCFLETESEVIPKKVIHCIISLVSVIS